MDRYNLGNQLGEGAFGVVYFATTKTTGEKRAIKQLRETHDTWQHGAQTREFKALITLAASQKQDSHIVRLFDVVREGDGLLYFVFEYMEHGSLHDLITNTIDQQSKMAAASTTDAIETAIFPDPTNAVSPSQQQNGCDCHVNSPQGISSITRQILQGLSFIHSKGFLHRDLKPENILIQGSTVKIADFGLARHFTHPNNATSHEKMTSYVATRWYRAPELLLGDDSYDMPMDMFAVGCIIAEMFALKPLFPGDNELDQLSRICKLRCVSSLQQEWKRGHDLALRRGWNVHQHEAENYHPADRNMDILSIGKERLHCAIPTASPSAIQLMDALLMLDPYQRPSAAFVMEQYEFAMRARCSKRQKLSIYPTPTQCFVPDQSATGSVLNSTIPQDRPVHVTPLLTRNEYKPIYYG